MGMIFTSGSDEGGDGIPNDEEGEVLPWNLFKQEAKKLEFCPVVYKGLLYRPNNFKNSVY